MAGDRKRHRRGRYGRRSNSRRDGDRRRKEAQLGTLEPVKLADAIVVDGDPLLGL
jgi:hypothetical protein